MEVRVDKKAYADGPAVLDGIRFAAEAGTTTAIVGPSGAGKSTLLSIIGGLDGQYTGAIGGVNGNGQRIGFVFQAPRLMPWLNVLDNLLLVTGKQAEARPRALRLIEQVGLKGREAAYPRQLSGGMQRRVALARAFIIEPRILLLDEPFISLDQPTATELRQLLDALCRQHRPITLLVTHDLNEAIATANRILFMSRNPGTILLDYTVKCRTTADVDDSAVGSERSELLSRHPRLLEGRMAPE